MKLFIWVTYRPVVSSRELCLMICNVIFYFLFSLSLSLFVLQFLSFLLSLQTIKMKSIMRRRSSKINQKNRSNMDTWTIPTNETPRKPDLGIKSKHTKKQGLSVSPMKG